MSKIFFSVIQRSLPWPHEPGPDLHQPQCEDDRNVSMAVLHVISSVPIPPSPPVSILQSVLHFLLSTFFISSTTGAWSRPGHWRFKQHQSLDQMMILDTKILVNLFNSILSLFVKPISPHLFDFMSWWQQRISNNREIIFCQFWEITKV